MHVNYIASNTYINYTSVHLKDVIIVLLVSSFLDNNGVLDISFKPNSCDVSMSKVSSLLFDPLICTQLTDSRSND